jgi:hypothetical protein
MYKMKKNKIRLQMPEMRFEREARDEMPKYSSVRTQFFLFVRFKGYQKSNSHAENGRHPSYRSGTMRVGKCPFPIFRRA